MLNGDQLEARYLIESRQDYSPKIDIASFPNQSDLPRLGSLASSGKLGDFVVEPIPNSEQDLDGTAQYAGAIAPNGSNGKTPAALAESSLPDPITQFPLDDLPETEPEPPHEQERGFLPVLRNFNFLVLWSGQVFSQLADKVYLVLMIMLIDSQFQSPDQTISGWVSSIMIAFTIPAVLFGSVAGVFVDHWSKKGVLVATNLIRGALVLTLLPLLWLTQGWIAWAGLPVGFGILLAITFLVSTLTQFFAPAEQSAIPLVVERRHLLSANSLYTTTMMASVIVGFAVGEPLLALADSVFAFIGWTGPDVGKELLVGGSYAIAGLLLLLLKTSEKIDSKDYETPKVWANIRDGLNYLREQGNVRAALIQLTILFSIFAALAVLAVRLAEVMPEIKASQFGFLLAAGGIGMAIGAVIVGHAGHWLPRHQLSFIGSMGVTASLITLSFLTTQLFPTLAVLVSLGLFAALVGIPMQTTIQEQTPEEMRGKVFGLQNNAINIALSLPLALAGIAESYFGLRAVLIALGGFALLGGVITRIITHPEVDKIAS